MGVLDGKVAIITGGSRGVGAATARAFVSEGARVVIADVADDRSKQLAAELGDAAVPVHCDVTQEDDWSATVQRAVDEFGGVDILANVAAVIFMGLIVDTPLDQYMRVQTVNSGGTFLGIRAVAPVMMGAKRGSIINYSSLGVFHVFPNISAYIASKQAVRGLTQAAAMELGPHGIRVNCVCGPGGNTSFTAEAPKSAAMEERMQAVMGAAASEPTGRLAQHAASLRTEDQPPAAGGFDWGVRSVPTMVFLASDGSAGYNGADFILDDGVSIGTTDFPG